MTNGQFEKETHAHVHMGNAKNSSISQDQSHAGVGLFWVILLFSCNKGDVARLKSSELDMNMTQGDEQIPHFNLSSKVMECYDNLIISIV